MPPSKEFTILVVCTGNICRSPVAEAMLVKKLGASPGLRISSAGLAAPIGIKPDPLAVKAANALGYEVSPDKRSQQVLPSHMQAADMIFVMDSGHKGLVSTRMPVATGKTFLLGHWESKEIADPIGQDEDYFADIITQLETGCESWSHQIKTMGLTN